MNTSSANPGRAASLEATALIAEDEPLLAESLQAELVRLWPALRIVANVRHGAAAVERALALRPDLVFLDIRMPGMNGLEAAQALTEDWEEHVPLPLMVFVTAYDQYALGAFDQAAVDYVLKPVQPDRLAKTCARLQAALTTRRVALHDAAKAIEASLAQLRGLLAPPGVAGAAAAPRSVIQASVGAAVHLVPVGDVLYFEAADKYVRVVTAAREYLIRTSLRLLTPQLDPQRFWQVHRRTVVRGDAIATAVRDESGTVQLTLRGHPDKLIASRLYAYLFKAM